MIAKCKVLRFGFREREAYNMTCINTKKVRDLKFFRGEKDPEESFLNLSYNF